MPILALNAFKSEIRIYHGGHAKEIVAKFGDMEKTIAQVGVYFQGFKTFLGFEVGSVPNENLLNQTGTKSCDNIIESNGQPARYPNLFSRKASHLEECVFFVKLSSRELYFVDLLGIMFIPSPQKDRI